MRTCRDCNQIKDETEFATQRYKGQFRFRSYCKKCHNKKNKESLSSERRRETRKRKSARRYEKLNILIENGSIPHLARRILQDCKNSDKRHGRITDLDFAYIQEAIEHPCVYCGEMNYRRSLDRIDNALGHTKENVVTACVRCNLTRSTMPYEAWLIVAKGMREAREKGLFNDWFGIKKCGKKA
jgi:hypothetical protein